MKLKTKNRQIVEESPFGVYIWRIGNSFVANEDGDALSIDSTKGDNERIDTLRKAVVYWCGEEIAAQGEAYFVSGARKISDEEYEHQRARQEAGLVPDPFDMGAVRDEMRYLKQHGRS